MERREMVRALIEARDPEFLFARRYIADAGIDLVLQPIEAKAFLELKAGEGVYEAQFALAKLLITGVLGDIDRRTAYQWCKRAADGGYVPALVLLSAFYAEGWGDVHRDDLQALTLLHRAAEAGYAHAAALLATAYTEGIRVPADQAKGRSFLIQAAESGDASSQFMLGIELLESADLQQKRAGARWIKAAADQDIAAAHRQLANLYEEGSAGLPHDEARARAHRQRADEVERGI